MRKLKLQVQITTDGFVGGPNGELDWMTWNWDQQLKDYVSELHVPVDTILLGRRMADGFINHWTSITENPQSPEYGFARKMIDTPKVVFSKTLDRSNWANTEVANDIANVNALKAQRGQDIIVYGGAGFNTSLIEHNLIDEYNLFVNPTAIGNGLTIFSKLPTKRSFELAESIPFECGIVLNKYVRK